MHRCHRYATPKQHHEPTFPDGPLERLEVRVLTRDRIYTFPLRSKDGAKVSSPSSQLAGQTSFGWSLTY